MRMPIFETLKLYSVHIKKDERGEVTDVAFVKEGFNIWAFLLSIVWALYHRCWLLAALCFAIWVVTELLAQSNWVSYGGVGIIQAGAFVIVGMLANDELRESLENRGYEHIGVTSGLSKMRAIQRFYDRFDGYAYS